MRPRHAYDDVRRARHVRPELLGAGGRLLHTATLLTAEPRDANPRARRLLTLALARTYACWDRLHGEDPYDHTRRCLMARFSVNAHRYSGRLPFRLRPAGPRPARSVAFITSTSRLIRFIVLFAAFADAVFV